MRILNLDPENYNKNAIEIYSSIGKYEERNVNREELKKIANLYHVLVLRFSHILDKEMIDLAKNLKYIVCNATGVDHIDENYANKKGIKIVSLRGEVDYLKNITSSAEHTWAMLLSLARRLPKACLNVQKGYWKRNLYVGDQLYKKTIGIYGLGRNGMMVANYANAFGMQVLAYDTNQNKEIKIPKYIKLVSSENELLGRSKILTLHIPLNESTYGLINAEKLNKMPDDSYLVNTSRGEIIDEESLIQLIGLNKFSGVALDVIRNESSINNSNLQKFNELEKIHNLIITPHIGGVTRDSWAETELFIANKLKAAVNNEN
jgi:D-3-phosphoglycerate dehydrogenase